MEPTKPKKEDEVTMLRRLITEHCRICNDCDWEDIPKDGLTTRTGYEQYPSLRAHRENASCEFAKYWAVWKGGQDASDQTAGGNASADGTAQED